VNDAVEALQAKVGADSSAVTTSLDYKVAQLEAISHGKILQVVRATDTTERITTSQTIVDASISVTITPSSASSSIIIIWTARAEADSGSSELGRLQITDSSNNQISGAEDHAFGNKSTDDALTALCVIAFDSPATTSATTYKGRFAGAGGATCKLRNAGVTGQMIALEVGA